MISDGFILYASDVSDAAVAEAREYIKTNRLTSEHVRLIKKEGQTLVVAKVNIRLEDV